MALLAVVRFTVLLLMMLAVASGALHAQEQERKIKERTIKQRFSNDENLTFDVRQGSTFGTQKFQTGNARVKDFYFTQRFGPKDYATKDYSGTKRSWFGDFKFSTSQAPTKGKYEIPNAAKQAETKTMPVNDARESSRTMPTDAFAKRDRSYLGPESKRLHHTVPQDKPVGWTGELRPMTIDDVRELLNKNK